jgi:hypothetical protein
MKAKWNLDELLAFYRDNFDARHTMPWWPKITSALMSAVEANLITLDPNNKWSVRIGANYSGWEVETGIESIDMEMYSARWAGLINAQSKRPGGALIVKIPFDYENCGAGSDVYSLMESGWKPLGRPETLGVIWMWREARVPFPGSGGPGRADFNYPTKHSLPSQNPLKVSDAPF